MSGGTEGVLSPHMTIFARSDRRRQEPRAKAAECRHRHTRDFLPEEIGRDAQIHETTDAVRLAMRDADIDDVNDVHFVQIKCPLLTSERVADALARGNTVVTSSGYASMGYSRGASALGVAKALGEIGPDVDEISAAPELGLVLLGRLLFSRDRTHAQRGDPGWQRCLFP